MSLRYKLIFSLFLISAGPLLVGIFIFYQTTAIEINKRIRTDLEAISKIQKFRVRSVFERFKEATNLVASRTQMRISFKDYILTKKEKSKNKAQKIINDAKKSTAGVLALDMIDLDGNIIISTNEKNKNKNIYATSNFLNALNHETSFEFKNEDENIYIIYSAPLLLENELIGILRVKFSSDPLALITGDYTGLGDSGETIITLKVHNNFKNIMPLRYKKDFFLSLWHKDSSLYPLISSSFTQKKEIKQMDLLKDYQDNEIFAFTQLEKTTNISILVKINKSEVIGFLSTLKWCIFWTVLILLIMIISLVINITSPHSRLTNVCKRIIKNLYSEIE